MARTPTVHDVARVAGVSRQTVSNVINAPEIVREDTRERVLQAIDDLGYRPHASARRLRTQKSSTIGIRLDPMVDGISGSILDRFLHALTEQADQQGLRILLFTARDPHDEIRQFGRLIDGRDVDAFVLTSTFYGDPRTQWLIEHDQVFVTFGRPWGIDGLGDPAHPWVDVDGRAGVRSATEALLERGLKRIAFLGWPAGSGTGDERAGGWQDAMAAAGLADGTARLREECVETVQAAREACAMLLEREPGVEAVVTASDSLALGVAVQTGGALPVIGFDNTPVSAAMGFSSLDQRPREVAEHVLALLAGGAEGSRHRLVTPDLVLREL